MSLDTDERPELIEFPAEYSIPGQTESFLHSNIQCLTSASREGSRMYEVMNADIEI